VGPMMRWQGDEPGRLLRQLAVPVVVGSMLVTVLAFAGVRSASGLAAFGLATTVAAMVAADFAAGVRRMRMSQDTGWLRATRLCAVRRRARNAGLVAHLGVAVAVVGIAASSVYTASAEQKLAVGERLSVSGVTAELAAVDRSRTEQVMSTAARIEVIDGATRTTTEPELRFFPAHGMTVAGPSVLSDLTGDVYLTLLSVDEGSRTATVRLAVNPLVGWIWAGGALMALGGAVALWPRRRTRPGAVAVPAEEPEQTLEVVPR
jgi:cytochrome c-type biogenesis protein CcmF